MYKIVDITAKCCSLCRFHSATSWCQILEMQTDFADECRACDAIQKHDAELAVQFYKDRIKEIEDA